MLISNVTDVHKSVIVINFHWDTLFQECFWSRSTNSLVGFASWLYAPIKPSHSFIKHYLSAYLRTRDFQRKIPYSCSGIRSSERILSNIVKVLRWILFNIKARNWHVQSPTKTDHKTWKGDCAKATRFFKQHQSLGVRGKRRGGGQIDSHIKVTRVLIISLRGRNCNLDLI